MDNHTSISSNYFHSLAFSSNFLLDHQVEHEEKPSTLPIIGSTTVSDNLHTHVKYQSQMSKKKRSRFLRIGNSFPITKPTTSNNSGVTKPKCTKKPPDPNAPKITRPCTECGKQFWSLKALFGHMRCHPERQWRGINPPPNFRRQNDSSFALEFGHDNRGMIMTDEDHEVASSLLLLASGPSTKTDDIGNESLSTAAAHDAAADVPSSSHHGLMLSEPANVVRDDLHYTPLHGWGRNRINIVDAAEPLIKCCRFECSSCKKVFGSHQALGGHRASHKNVKGCHKAALAASASGSGLTTQAVKAHVFDNLDLNFPPPVTLSEGDSSSSYSSSYSGSALDLRLRL